MDPVATVASIIDRIVSVKNYLDQVQENKELCIHLANRLVTFQIILNDVNLRSHDRFDCLVSSLEALVEEAEELMGSFLPHKSRKGKGNVVDAFNRVERFLSRATNSNVDRKRFVQVDQRLSVLRDDFDAISSIVHRNEKPLSTMFETVVQSMKNDLVQEINRIRDEVARGEAMPDDIERLLDAPQEVQQAIDALAQELHCEDLPVPHIDTPQMQQYVAANVEKIVSLSQMPRSAGSPVPVFPSEEEDISGSFDFREEDKLGQAKSYGVTFKATYRPDGKQYALKRVNVRQSRLSDEVIQREAESLKQLCHSNIVRCFYSFFDKADAFFYMVMELVLGKTLTAYVRSPRPPSGRVMLKWLRQLTSALVYMHGDCRLVHRDLKPDNIMITQDMEDVKIIDFGLARNVGLQGRTEAAELERMTAGVGTPLYMSYEKMEGLSYDGRDDVWAVGCIFLELILQQELRLVRLAKDDAQRRLKLQAVIQTDPVLGAVVCRILGHQLQEQRPSSMELLLLLEDVDVTAAPPVAPLPPPPELVASSLEESLPDPSVSSSTDSAYTSGVMSATPLQSLSMAESIGLRGCREYLGQPVAASGETIHGEYRQEMCTFPESDQPRLQQALQSMKTRYLNDAPTGIMVKIQPPAVVVESVALGERNGEATSSGPDIVRTVQSNAVPLVSSRKTSIDTSRLPFTNASLRSAVELWFYNKRKAESEHGPIGEWNLTGVTDTSELFKDRETFNTDISKWNLSNVTDMSHMFEGASSFNQPLDSWNVSNVTNMSGMFEGASSFNQPLDSWNVSNVTNMSGMFEGASSFNQPLDRWNVSIVRNGFDMCVGLLQFKRGLVTWLRKCFYCLFLVGLVFILWTGSMYCIFDGAFNQPLHSWHLSSITNMSHMFQGSSSFNQPLDRLDVSSVTNMPLMSSLETLVPDPSVSSSTDSACTSGVTSATPLQSLLMAESIGLLVYLGCQADLGQRVATSGETIDGAYLQKMCTFPESEQLAMLQELEGNNSLLRKPRLQQVLQLLKTYHSNGVPDDVMAKIQPPAVVVNSIALGGGKATISRPDIVRTVQSNAVLATCETPTDASWLPFTNDSLRSAVELWFYDKRKAESEHGPIGDWSLTGVTDTSELFKDRETFNTDISKWNLSNVTNMSHMFEGASSFNQPLNSWNVSNVTNMSGMFAGASSFNQPLNSWNVSNVTDMSGMLAGASSFNQPLDRWNVSNVTDMSGIYFGASSFNQPLDGWNMSGVTNVAGMFWGASSFNQPLGSWSVSNVTNMSHMFDGASLFDHPLDSWDVSNVTDMSCMFVGASSFNQPLDRWDVSNVTDMSHMFHEASSFNQPLGSWNVSNVTDMCGMFAEASAFNQPLESWNVRNITNMSGMFDGALKVNRGRLAWFRG